MRRILLGEITDSTIIHDTMKSMGFRSGELFVCVYFCLSETGLADDLMKHFVEMLKNRFKWPCVVPFMKDVVATFPQRKRFENIQNLLAFLNDSNIKAGRSESFDDFSKLPDALGQARDALETGKSTDSSKMMFWYKDYAQLAIVKKLAATENIEVFYHPAVLFLNKYDQEHGTEYCKTLRFLSEYSGTQKQLADMLFIHRNTLQYRLDRLGELVEINLNDPEERFRIALTCRLLDVKQKL
jgi:DNA-binding PucR family transcriptional regulator